MKNSQNEKKKEKDKDKDKELIIIPQLSYNFNISDIIVKYIIEKIISLSITQSLKNKIESQINNFCFNEMKESLSLALYIDFVNYDKDDITHKKTLLDFKSHSSRDILEDKNKSNLILNKSEIIRKYKYSSELDPEIPYEGSINLDVFKTPKKEKNSIKETEKSPNRKYFMKYIKEQKKEQKELIKKDPNLGKLLNGLILREKYNNDDIENNKFNVLRNQGLVKKELNLRNSISKEDKEPFIDNIEKINILESHKLDIIPKFSSVIEEKYVLFCDPINTNKNNWSIIEQPKVPPIDRDAATKINFIKNIFRTKKTKTLINKQEETTEETSQQKKEIASSIKSSATKKAKNYTYSSKNKLEPEDNNPRRKKYAPILEFPSYDIDPKTLGGDTESEELKRLRENLEKELIEKKLEQSRKLQKEREIQALEKAREEKRKELAHKNVTVDIKGDIVYIKSLNVNDFINDFTRMKSKFKEIKTIHSVSKTSLQQKAKVEKNIINIFDQIDKEKSKKKQKKNYMKSSKKDDRQQGGNNSRFLGIMERMRDPIIAAGSNFEIMNPEVGVTLKEDEKTKEGGRDFYKKCNKYSIEVFEETLNKTINSNFYSTQRNSIFNANVNNINNTTGNNKTLKKLKSKILKEENMNEIINKAEDNIKNKNLNLMIPNEVNNRLLVKAQNLKLALNSLDLITENEEKYFSEKKKNKSKNIIKKKDNLYDLFNKNRNNYEEINKFAKTLVGSNNWGDNLFRQKKQEINFKRPQKPLDIEIKREVPLNLLNHLPRKRLPPINMTNRMNNERSMGMGYTMSDGFFGRKKHMRILLSDGNITKDQDINKNDNNEVKNISNKPNVEKENSKDKFSYTSTSGFFQKQTGE